MLVENACNPYEVVIEMKKITIITINYNNIEGLKKTIQSVLQQSIIHQSIAKDTDSRGLAMEYILIDGGSTDGSKELIETIYNELTNSFVLKNPISYWISEKDRGIYHAMNKGIQKAQGEYILFLNSGDYLATSKVIEEVMLQMNEESDFYCGDILYDDEKHSVIKSPTNISAVHLFNSFIPHQASFIRTSLLKKRPYREDLKIAADWEQMVYELIYRNVSYKKVELVVTIFDSTGISSNKEKSSQLLERDIALKGIFPERMYEYISLSQKRINTSDSFDIEIGSLKYDLILIKKSVKRLMINLSMRYRFFKLFI